MIGFLPSTTFYALAVVWFALIALTPRGVILVLSFGQSRISDTGVRALRILGLVFAAASLIQLTWEIMRA